VRHPRHATALAALPHRGRFGAPRPAALDGLPLPPAAMPSHSDSRPLKAWRYVGVFGTELMVCAATVRIGRGRQSFWAVWDRRRRQLHERTTLGRGGVRLAPGRVSVHDGGVRIELALAETDGVESICPSGNAYAWTRKQGGVAATGTVTLPGGGPTPLAARAVIDDSAGYHQRHTRWRWSAGVGHAVDGRAVAWNLVDGVNDPPHGSERTVWIAGEPAEAAAVTFADDLSQVGDLHFTAEATRARRERLLVISSRYRQPFGHFAGTLPGPEPLALAAGLGVMEEHDARW
jgi:hypothetical protein